MTRKHLLASASLLGLCLTAGAFAAPPPSTNWTDGVSSWFTAGNWDNGVPTSSRAANITNGGTARINSTASASSVFIAANSTVDIQAGGSLVTPFIQLGDNLTANSPGTLLLSGSTNVNVGSQLAMVNGLLRSQVTGTPAITDLSIYDAFHTGDVSTISAAAGTILTLGTGGTIEMGTSTTGATIKFGSSTDTGTVVIDGFTTGSFQTTIEVVGGTARDGAGSGLAAALDNIASFTIDSGATVDLADHNTPFAVHGANLLGAGNLKLGTLTTTAVNLIDGNFSGVISGAGKVNIIAGGTGSPVIFSGANTYTGLTSIAAGKTLQLGTGAAGGSLAGNVANSGALTFSGTGTSTVSGVISGGGTVVKGGQGTAILSGINTYTGNTTLNGGTLVINGSIATSTLVMNGGTLKGNGTIGALNLTGGTAVAPGNSIGTLNVASVTFNSGSTYQAEVDPTGASDLINSTGTATLGNATLALQPLAGTYNPVTSYHLITASSVIGTFGTVTITNATLTPTMTYSTTGVDVSLMRNDLAFGTAYGTSANQIAAGGAVSAGTISTTLYQKLALAANNAAAVPAALDALSGEIHASALSFILQDASSQRAVMLSGIRNLPKSGGGQGVTLWARANGNWSNEKSDGNAAALKSDGMDASFGADYAFSDIAQIGVEGGFDNSTLRAPARSSSARLTGGHVGGYGSVDLMPVTLRSGFLVGWNTAKTTRSVAFTGVSDTNTSTQNGDTLQFFGEASYFIPVSDYSISPFFGVSWAQAHLDGFSEAGGITALSGNQASPNQTMFSFGADITGKLPFSGAVMLVPSVRLAWQQSLNNSPVGRNVTLIGTGKSFTVLGAPLDRDSLLVDAALGFDLGHSANIRFGYSGSYSTIAVSHSINGTLSWSF